MKLAHIRLLDPQPPLMLVLFILTQAFSPLPGARLFLHRPSLRSAATARAPPSPGLSGIRAQILVYPVPATHGKTCEAFADEQLVETGRPQIPMIRANGVQRARFHRCCAEDKKRKSFLFSEQQRSTSEDDASTKNVMIYLRGDGWATGLIL